MSKQPGPPPTPVAVHTVRLDDHQLVYVGQHERLPHLRTQGSRTAIEALRQRYPVYVDDATLERVKEALKAQSINI
jgi:hypothetical protein